MSSGETNGLLRVCNGVIALVSLAMIIKEGIHTPPDQLPTTELAITAVMGAISAHHYVTGRWLPWSKA